MPANSRWDLIRGLKGKWTLPLLLTACFIYERQIFLQQCVQDYLILFLNRFSRNTGHRMYRLPRSLLSLPRAMTHLVAWNICQLCFTCASATLNGTWKIKHQALLLSLHYCNIIFTFCNILLTKGAVVFMLHLRPVHIYSAGLLHLCKYREKEYP